MIRINLLPQEEQVVRTSSMQIRRPSGILMPLIILAGSVTLVVAAVVHQQAQVQSLSKDLQDVEVEIVKLAPEVALVERLAKERAELDLRLSIIDQLSGERFHAVRLIDELDRAVPDYLWMVSAMQVGQTNMNLEGVTFSNLIVADFMTRLDRSPYFANIDLTVAQRGVIDERPVTQFQISMDLTPTAQQRPVGDN